MMADGELGAAATPADRVLVIERSLRRAARAGLERLDRSGAGETLDGAARLHRDASGRGAAARRRVAGCIRRDADGEELWQGGVYREVAEPERLVFTFAWDGPDGPSGAGNPGDDTLRSKMAPTGPG